ncbi:MAG: CvpA family protein [Rhodospirillales bacterium]|nr:CvpA family protein [Rhodospirillales bacterium]
MGGWPVNGVDIAVAVVLLLSGLFAYARGLVHEVLAMATWVGAAFAALYGLPLARPYARAYISINWLADLAAGAAIFLVSLLVLSMITKAISSSVRDSQLNMLDRSLGFLFGLARGAVIVCLLYMSAIWILPEDERPDWMMKAKSRPLLEQGVALIESLLPNEIGGAERAAKQAADQAKDALETKKLLDKLTRPEPKAEPEKSKSGYGNAERRDMDKLIKSTQ